MTTPPTARLALVGAGAIAAEHAAAIDGTDGLRLVRVVDRHSDRASALAARHGATAGIDPESLTGSDVDAVVICTSPESHVPLAIDALRAGKAVLVEKPVALSLAELDRLLAAVERYPGPLLAGQTARFQPAHLALAEAVAAGEIGRPRLVHISWYAGHVWPGGWRGWQLDEGRSGGHVVHNGVHALDLATWLLDDEPERVFARPLRTWAPGMPTPDSFHIIARYRGGGQAVIELSYGLRRRGALLRRVHVAGTAGSLVTSTEDEPPADTWPPLPPAGVADAMAHQYRHFRDVVHGRARPVTTPAQVRGALAAALAAGRSSGTGAFEDAGGAR